jgi:hypothetical protein
MKRFSLILGVLLACATLASAESLRYDFWNIPREEAQSVYMLAGPAAAASAPGNFTLIGNDFSGTASGCGTSCSLTITPGGTVAANTLIIFYGTGYWTGSGTSFGTWTFTFNANGTAYPATLSPHSPCGTYVTPGGGQVIALGYITSSVACASGCTFVAAYSGASSDFTLDIEMYELFSATHPIHFDKDVCANVTTQTATPINQPSITPTYTNSLLYGAPFTGCGDTSTDASGPTTPWTRGNNYPGEGAGDFYILSSSAGATAANWPDTCNPDYWAAVTMSFYSQ